MNGTQFRAILILYWMFLKLYPVNMKKKKILKPQLLKYNIGLADFLIQELLNLQ
ncbi:hypothetical protein pb186bvf_013508 [Paramecium bursaria]